MKIHPSFIGIDPEVIKLRNATYNGVKSNTIKEISRITGYSTFNICQMIIEHTKNQHGIEGKI